MSKVKLFFTLSGYQLTWLMCVFCEILYKSFFPGLICGLIFLFLVFMNTRNKRKFTFIVFSISAAGYLFDSILVNFKIYNFDTSLYLGFLPVWMIVLWPCFAALFDEVFVFLKKYKLIAALISGSLGPLTYYAGSPLGLININQFSLFLFLMIIFWIFLMLFYLNFLLRIKFN